MSTNVAALSIEMRAQTRDYNKKMAGATRDARRYARHAKAANDANGGLSRSFRNAANHASVLQGPLGGVSGRLSAVASGLQAVGPAGLAAGVGLTAMTAVVGQSLRVFAMYERITFKIAALLKSTGNASGLTAKQLDAQSRSVARNTLASTQGIKSAQAILLTFKTVQGETFNEAVRLSQDLAAVMGGDAKSAALQLGKALEDPATGLTALKRSGVSFTESEKEQIKVMQEAGRVADAQRMILEKLAGQIGGAGSAEAQGLSGAVDTLTQEWEELLEALGNSGPGQGATDTIGILAKGVRNLKDEMFPDEALEFQNLLRERVEIEQKLQDIRKNGTGLANLLTGNTAAALEGEKHAINQQLRALQEKREAEIKSQKAAQEAAAEARKAAEADRLATVEKEKQKKLMEEQLKLQKQMLKETEARAKKKDSLYHKLFGGEKDKRPVLENFAFNNYAKAAKQATQDGRNDDFKRMMEQMKAQLEASKDSSYRYDLQGMQDVITLLNKQAGEKPEKIGTVEFKVAGQSVEMQGSSSGMKSFTDALKSALGAEAAAVSVS